MDGSAAVAVDKLNAEVARSVWCAMHKTRVVGGDHLRQPTIGVLVDELHHLCPRDVVSGVGASPLLLYIRKGDDSRQVGIDGSEV